jgi:E3 ubiquitin-protein ligase BIG BROTHER-like protein
MLVRQYLEMHGFSIDMLNFDEPHGVPTDLHLPEFVYHKSAGISEQICVICQCDYEDGDVLLTTPCVHNFHKECVAKWFEKNSKCPLCKEEIQHDDGDDDSDDNLDSSGGLDIDDNLLSLGPL